MPKNLRPETLIFLECLAEAIGETAATLARPTRANLTRSYDNEPLDRKLRRLAARGVITLPEPTDPRVLRLTEVGFTLARGEFAPEQRWARQWDGHWRMVLFDIAEHDRPVRTRLRAALRHAKLGYLQGSVWISPDPLEQLRSSIRSITANPESLLFFDGRPSAGETDAAIVAGAWDFARLDEAHRECLGILGHPPADSDPAHRWRTWLLKERDAWIRALALDPLLPSPLLPNGYLGREVHALRRSMLRRAWPHNLE